MSREVSEPRVQIDAWRPSSPDCVTPHVLHFRRCRKRKIRSKLRPAEGELDLKEPKGWSSGDYRRTKRHKHLNMVQGF